MTASPAAPIAVGIVANPASGRDVRRVLGWASVFPTGEKIHVVLRLLAGLGAQGVAVAWMPPDGAGIAAHVRDAAARARREAPLPEVRVLEMPLTGTAADTMEATAAMVGRGVRAIAVLGGDGTHRAVAARCGEVSLATLSTGTNNAFPRSGEATLVGMATGLVATGRVGADVALRRHKRLRVTGGGVDRIALVDVALSHRTATGARALWRADELSDAYLAFGEPTSVGLASLAGLCEPVGRDDPWGLHLALGDGPALQAPLLPGVVQPVRVGARRRLLPQAPVALPDRAGTLAFDGERELEIAPGHGLRIVLELDGPRTIDVDAVLAHAARHGLMFSPPSP